jgi:hypothetical protein
MKVISPKVKLREDYLSTSVQPGDELAKGTKDITVVYELPAGEIKTPEEVGIYDTGIFLSVLSTFETPEIEKNNNIIVIKDGRKKLEFHTAPLNTLPERKTKGDELYAEGTTVLGFAFTSDDLKALLRDINVLDFNEIKIVGGSSGINFACKNSVTSDNILIKVPDNLVGKADNVEFVVPSVEVLSALMEGSYKVDIRSCIIPGKEKAILIAKMTNVEVESGTLTYTIIGK